MISSWIEIPLAKLLSERRESPCLDHVISGQQPLIAKIRFADGGIELRSDGQTKTKLITVRPGDLLVSGINAAKGAIALYEPQDARPAAATIHYGAYKINNSLIRPRFLWLLLRHSLFRTILERNVPEGIKTELKPKRFLPIPIPLPQLGEQDRLLGIIESIHTRMDETSNLRDAIESEREEMLRAYARELAKDAPRRPLVEVAPLVRRPVVIDKTAMYPELGIRSFGKGTFHKPALSGAEVGTKRLYRIEPGDLLFSNVFSWEGAIAVVQEGDAGRFGSHRFITCVPDPAFATAEFLRCWLLTEEGMAHILEASPGAAGRNRTLGLKKLMVIPVPVPPLEGQKRLSELCRKVTAARQVQDSVAGELKHIMPALLDRAFSGDL